MKNRAILLLTACTLAAPAAIARPSAASVKLEKGVVSAADPRAAEAGAEVLRAGGNATDAALAVLVALTVVEPQSSGIGGGGFMLFDDGKGHVESIDGRETAPAAATPAWFKVDGKFLTTAQAIPGGLSVGVPGNVALMAAAHRKHGRIAWKRLFTPAIRLARDGYEMTPRLNQFLSRYRIDNSLPPELRYLTSSASALSPQSRALFYGSDGSPLPVGTTIRNTALADFLTKLAAKGPRAFYAGANAREIVRAVSTAPRNPAAMTLRDLAGYRAKSRDPVCTTYRAWRLCGMGPPSSGATTVFGVLGVLERFDLAALGKESPTAWHLFAEAQRLAFADRERYLADADFVPVPVAGLLAPEYLGARSQLIAPDRTMADVAAGQPKGALVASADSVTPDVPSTSHFSVIDRQGSAVTMTSTIESSFGSGLMVNGYFLNNELTDFSLVPEQNSKPVANRIEAGKRPRSAMSPTLVYSPDGQLRMAIGAAGGSTIPAQVAKAIIGVIDWKLSAQDAIALPALFAPAGDTVFVEQGSALEAMVPALTALGHAKVLPRQLPLKANAVEIVEGKVQGAADPRSEGRAITE
jgi:gamma-glutamyltranspeptidase / glutathione hydrolase